MPSEEFTRLVGLYRRYAHAVTEYLSLVSRCEDTVGSYRAVVDSRKEYHDALCLYCMMRGIDSCEDIDSAVKGYIAGYVNVVAPREGDDD